MKITGHIEKWGAGVLGAVSLVLLAHLVLQFNRTGWGNARPGARTPPITNKARSVAGAKGEGGKQKTPDELSRYDPAVKQDLLKKFEDRPLPELRRDPFEFVAGPSKAAPLQAAVQAAAPAAPQPPPPPPVTLKLLGYTEGKGGVKEAMVSEEDQIYVVHEGDSVGTRYKILKITPTVVTVEDATLHQNVDLPVPQ